MHSGVADGEGVATAEVKRDLDEVDDKVDEPRADAAGVKLHALTQAIPEGMGVVKSAREVCVVVEIEKDALELEVGVTRPTDVVGVATNGLGAEPPWEMSAPGDASATAGEPPGRTTRREDTTACSLPTSAGAHSSATPAAAASKSALTRGAIVEGAMS